MTMSSSTDFIVVGAGVAGSSTALSLVRAGHSVAVLDRSKDGFAAPDAASNDLNKIIRADYQDQHYSDLAKEAISKWRRDALFSPYYHEVGLLLRSGLISNSSSSSAAFRETSKSYVSTGVARAVSNPSNLSLELPKEGSELPKLAHELQSREEALQSFPQNSRDILGDVTEGYGNEETSGNFQVAYLNPRAGWAEANEATRNCLREAIRLGAKVYGDSEISELILDEDRSTIKGVKTLKGREHHLKNIQSGNVILCCGSWFKEIISKLTSTSLPKGISEKIQKVAAPSAQCVLTLKVPDDQRHKFKDTPVVLNFRTGFYLFEPNSEGIMKIAIHGEGYQTPTPPLGVDSVEIKPPHFPPSTSTSSSPPSSSGSSIQSNHSIPPSKISEMLSELYEIYPTLKSIPIIGSRVCWYSDSKDENWIIDRHPSLHNLVVCTGDSGHLFKFLPSLGDLICARMGLKGFKPLTDHQQKVFGFDHHFAMIHSKDVEMADSGRAKNKGEDQNGNLRARL